MKKMLTMFLSGMLLCVIINICEATPITYKLSGTVNRHYRTFNQFSVGDSVSCFFTIDPDLEPFARDIVDCRSEYFTGELNVNIHGMSYVFSHTVTSVYDDVYETLGFYQVGLNDGVWVNSNCNSYGSEFLGYERVSCCFQLGSQNNTMLLDTSIPDLALIFPVADYIAEGIITFHNGSTDPWVTFTITSIEQISESLPEAGAERNIDF